MEIFIFGVGNVRTLLKREHMLFFEEKLSNIRLRRWLHAVVVNEVFAQLFSKKRVLLFKENVTFSSP